MASDLPTVTAFKLNSYLGVWYEIARLPMKHQPKDSTDVSATYSLNDDGTVKVLNRCLDGQKQLDEATGHATVVNGNQGKLEVSFLPEGLRWIPFTKGDYWILKIDSSYKTALVGEPNKDYMWLLHREPVLDDGIKKEYLDYAVSLGYDISELIHTVHTGQPTA